MEVLRSKRCCASSSKGEIKQVLLVGFQHPPPPPVFLGFYPRPSHRGNKLTLALLGVSSGGGGGGGGAEIQLCDCVQ